jgi:predicted small lipoprotein YifL
MRALFPVVLLVFMLQGCGLKGPLYLPKPIEQQRSTAQQKKDAQQQPQQDQPQSQ